MGQEQIDYYLHPERRELAVIVFGVPDPMWLSQDGLDDLQTVHQIALGDEPCNDHGERAVVLPVVIRSMDPVDAVNEIESYYGARRLVWPFVGGEPEQSEWMWRWVGDDLPLLVAAWDLWPISEDDAHVFATEAKRCYEASKLDTMFQYYDVIGNSTEHEIETDETEDLQELLALPHSAEEEAEIEAEIWRLRQKVVTDMENEFIHPDHGVGDAQVPPIQLPREQDALWTSLQRLSQHNWYVLSQAYGDEADHDGRRFVYSNRRICPWF